MTDDTLTAANRQLRERVQQQEFDEKLLRRALVDLQVRLAEVERQAEMYAENCTNKIQEVLALQRKHAELKASNVKHVSECVSLTLQFDNAKREIQRLREALGECIKTFDYLVFHRVAGMDALLYESHNRTSPGRTVETAKRLARQALHAARPGEAGE